ncbi:MAG TPA: insulinase family protein, partial [Patescibacteria group bacterium]|nr:insulinase family protein [Patescibacteria group bacterium]
AYQDTGSIVVQAGLDKQRLTQAIGLILAELKKVRAAGVSDKELKSAKEFLKGKLVLELEDSEEVADWYGKQLLLLDKIYTPQERLKKIFKVSQADIKKVAAEIFRQQRINFALIGPFKDKNKFREILHF